MIGLTAVEVLAVCLGFGLVLAVLIVVCNCLTTCWDMISHKRKKQKVEKLPDHYVDEIHRLLHQNQKSREYSCVFVESCRSSPHLEYLNESRLLSPPIVHPRQKQINKMAKMVHMSEDSQETKTTDDSLKDEEYSEDTSKRRTWNGLTDPMFDTLPMPSCNTNICVINEEDARISSKSSDKQMFGMKIETTV